MVLGGSTWGVAWGAAMWGSCLELYVIARKGLWGVVTDNVGYVLASTCLKIEGVFDVEVVEALGARHALQVAFDAGLQRLVLETDCLKLFTHLSKKIVEPTIFGLIVKDILAISSLGATVKYSHVRKQGNTVAHIRPSLAIIH
uniref:RNase H type-1 domain-containing protein n=1 Tax=Chenopodium quinoa TaxID=63459 RepID=A0A803N0E3_CHEQI